jgi:predicted nucleic acid-binding protein
MKCLLDVSALIAYGFRQHSFHDRVGAWIRSRKGDRFLTCSITELGFVRVLGNERSYGMDVAQARLLLMELKAWRAMPLEFLPDGNNISALPAWVKSPAQTTDGHLLQLASVNGAVLVTLDERIPEALLIPK